MGSLDRLIDPATIAIAGVSADPAKHGARVLSNLRRLGFAGEIWGINPGLPDIEGLEVVPSVADLEFPPDLLIAAIPAHGVTDLVALSEGIGGVIVFASGFAETGAEGSGAQRELLEAARRSRTRLLGPNSAGIIRPDRGLAASFLTCLDRQPDEMRTGPIAIVTQSGGTGSYIHNLAAARGDGIAISISTGNEADIKLGEAMEVAAGIEGVEVVVAVVEALRDGAEFIRASESARNAGKRVVVCPLGNGRRSTALMASHTGALAIPEAISGGVFDALGLGLAETPAEAYEMASVIARTGEVGGSRVGIVTHSGGVAILLSDLAERHGLDLPQPGDTLASQLSGSLDHGSMSNPLDMGGIIGGPSRFGATVAGFADSGAYDVVLAVSTAHPPAHTPERVRSLIDTDMGVPIVHLWMAGDQAEEGLKEIRRRGLPVTEEPRAAIRALAAMTRRHWPRPNREPLGGGPEEWDIPPLSGFPVRSRDEAVAGAEDVGYPVVLKLEAEGVLHKTEAGGVLLDIRDSREVMDAHDELREIATDNGWSDATVRVQPFRPGLEMIVGAIRHESFGPLVSVGFGGVLTEVARDVVFAPAPVDSAEAVSMIERLQARRLLDGYRGSPPADIPELARIVTVVSQGILGADIEQFEINPLTWDGRAWLSIDWMVVPAAPREA